MENAAWAVGAVGRDITADPGRSPLGQAIETSYAVLGSGFLLRAEPGAHRVAIYRLDLNLDPAQLVDQRSCEIRPDLVAVHAVGTRHFMVMIEAATGELRVRRIADDGSLGERVDRARVAGPWTDLRTFTMRGSAHILLLDRTRGIIEVHRLSGAGTLGDRLSHTASQPGTTGIEVCSDGSRAHVLTIASDRSTLQLAVLTPDGRLGTADVSSGHDSVMTIDIADLSNPYGDGDPILLGFERRSGRYTAWRIAEGQLAEVVESGTWPAGWTSITPLPVDEPAYRLFDAATGRASVQRLDSRCLGRDAGTLADRKVR